MLDWAIAKTGDGDRLAVLRKLGDRFHKPGHQPKRLLCGVAGYGLAIVLRGFGG